MEPALPQFQLMAWTEAGELVLSRGVSARTWSLSGKNDADVFVPELGDGAVFLRVGADGQAFLTTGQAGAEAPTPLKIGEPVKFGDLTWTLVRGSVAEAAAPAAAASEGSRYATFLSDLVLWISRPMSGTQELRDGLREFLSLIVDNTPAASGTPSAL